MEAKSEITNHLRRPLCPPAQTKCNSCHRSYLSSSLRPTRKSKTVSYRKTRREEQGFKVQVKAIQHDSSSELGRHAAEV